MSPIPMHVYQEGYVSNIKLLSLFQNTALVSGMVGAKMRSGFLGTS